MTPANLTLAYLLHCSDCRHDTQLTITEYQKQLSEPDGWKCGHCGSTENVVFDEENYRKRTGNERQTL